MVSGRGIAVYSYDDMVLIPTLDISAVPTLGRLELCLFVSERYVVSSGNSYIKRFIFDRPRYESITLNQKTPRWCCFKMLISSSFLSSLAGVCNMLGRIFSGVVGNIKGVNNLVLHNAAVVTIGVACILNMFWYGLLAAIYVFFCGLEIDL